MKRKPVFYVALFEGIAGLDLDGRFNINNGGCGCFARMMKEYLPELKIIYMADCEEYRDKYEHNEESACSHVVLTDGRMYYDAQGSHDPNEYKQDSRIHQIRFEVDEEYLNNSLEIAYWNPDFERNTLPVIEEEVNNIIKNNQAND